MKILGIDPGTAHTGYGLVGIEPDRLRSLDFGSITTKTSQTTDQRLVVIHTEITNLAKASLPDVAVVEDLFFFKNVRSAIGVAQARGVIICALAQLGIKTFSYTPLQIKQELTGYGRAEKKQIQSAVRKELRLRKLPRPNHAADALATAICHIKKTNLN